MALEEFEKEEMNEREKGYVRMRKILNYGMGLIIMGIGVLFLMPDKLPKNFVDGRDPLMLKFFAGLCILYGVFRIFRGYTGNYRK